jgi:P-type Ca2+ transporter type 2C
VTAPPLSEIVSLYPYAGLSYATTICSDKAGTLTTNRMTVVAGTFGNVSFSKSESGKSDETKMAQWAASLSQQAKQAIIQSVAINSTAFEGEENGQTTFIGSKAETALLQLAHDHLGMQVLAQTRANEEVIQMFPFDSKKKCMGACIKLKDGSGYHLLVKGASEILLNYCSAKANLDDLTEARLSSEERKSIRTTIDKYASQSLRAIGLVCKDFEAWPPAHAEVEEGHADFASLLKDLTFFGLVGIQDPARPGVPEAVAKGRDPSSGSSRMLSSRRFYPTCKSSPDHRPRTSESR